MKARFMKWSGGKMSTYYRLKSLILVTALTRRDPLRGSQRKVVNLKTGGHAWMGFHIQRDPVEVTCQVLGGSSQR